MCGLDDQFVWIGLHEPTEEEFDSVRREFALHPLAVEDAINAHQRPKLEEYDDSVFVVLKTARYVDHEEVVQLGEIDLFIGEGFIVSVRHGAASGLEQVRAEIEQREELLRKGPGAVLHAVVDRVVDDYKPVIDALETDIEEVEADVFSPDRQASAQRIYKLKREVLEFLHAVSPLADPLEQLSRGHLGFVDKKTRAYFRDVHEHLIRSAERLENDRDLLTSVLTANLTQISVQQNEDIRKISAWVAIVAVPTMIAGVYGMNFENMPELGWRYGYPMALAIMLAACSGLYGWFKRSQWL